MTTCVTKRLELEMEGKADNYSISTWRKNKKEKKNAKKREYYKNNQENPVLVQ